VGINEVKPSATTGGGFVEFFNSTAADFDLQGHYLSDSLSNLTKYQITNPLVVPAGGLATIGFAESNLSLATTTSVILTKPDGTSVVQAISAAIPLDGRSLGQKPSGSGSWFQFGQASPGTANDSNPALRANRLSEVRFAANGRATEIEVANTGLTNVNLTGLFVASAANFSDKVPFTGSLAPGGYATAAVNFPTSAAGEVTIYLIDSTNSVLDAAEVRRTTGVSTAERFPLASNVWYTNTGVGTSGADNAPARSEAIVISEIMAHPPSRHDDGEFLELHNRSANAVSLEGWSMDKGVDFVFPAGTSIPAGGYAILAKNPAYIAASYPGLSAAVYGPYGGNLRNGGELLVLLDNLGREADRVDYKFGGQWPQKASSEGSSLELIHPDMDNSLGSSWRDSDESNKSDFATYSFTGTYRQIRGIPNATAPTVATAMHELYLTLVSDGHVVMKNIKLAKSTAPGTNMIANGDATSHGTGTGVNGFLCTGTHSQSDTLADGFNLISTGTGDTKNNKAEADITGLVAGDILTFSFDARWKSGLPLLIAQTWDRSWGNLFRLPIPANLGTPGAANSTAISASAPTVDNMLHSPPVPSSAQAVTVTARVSSAAGGATVELLERNDVVAGGGAWTTRPMADNGVAPDVRANDGIFSVSVPAKGDGTITQFYVKATGANGQINECPRNGATRPGLWIVDNTPATSSPGILSERYIMAQFDRNAFNQGTGFSAAYDFNFPRMSNYAFNSTMIMGETEIYYNCEVRKGGSPWTRDGGNGMTRLRYKTPGDAVLRNRSKSGLDNDPAGVSRFHNRTVRYMLYLFGYQIPDSEFVQRIFNADAPSLADDQEQTDTDFFERAYGDGGELYEIDDAWYIYDNTDGSETNRIDAGSVTGRWALLDWTSGSAPSPSVTSPIFWHGNWPCRFPEDRYDYSALSSFVINAANNNTAPTAGTVAEADWIRRMSQMLDIEKTALYTAVRGYIGDWDNFTFNRGKNGFFYRRPTDGKFEFHHWDSDLGFQSPYETGVFYGGAGGVGWTNLLNRPYFKRLFIGYLHELYSKYTLNSPRMYAYLDAMNYQASNADSLAPFKTNQFDYRNWFSLRKTRTETELNTAGNNLTRLFVITNTNNQTVATPSINLTGTAPSSIVKVDVLNHPEATFSWNPTVSDYGIWNLNGLRLASGLNELTVRGLDLNGNVVSTLPFNVTLSSNGPPALSLVIEPASLNFGLNETVLFDASGSVDPEGAPLSYAWTILPTQGATLTNPTPAKTEARFTIPGKYSVNLIITDAAGLTATVTKEFAVYSADDFAPFADGDALSGDFTTENLEYRDNFSNLPWYTLEDITGRLQIHIMSDATRPLASPTYTHPLVTRDLPDLGNWLLQTDLELMTRQFGTFMTGLWVEFNNAGTLTRYALAYDGGNNTADAALRVLSATGVGDFTQLSTLPYTTGSSAMKLRITREGGSLLFHTIRDGVPVSLHTAALPATATAVKGGVFASTTPTVTGVPAANVTSSPEVRVAFDYVLLADPANTSSVLSNLRITKIQYNPLTGPEYVELKNIGTTSVDLNGVNFPAGNPFANGFTFGNVSLAPGELAVITADQAAFRDTYGNVARIIGIWTGGGLSNGGERVTLRDTNGNRVHHFVYGDSTAPTWPTTPDGQGPALEIINPQGNYDLGNNWKPSAALAEPGVSPDTDGDGMADNLELRFGTDPNNSGSLPVAGYTVLPNGSRSIAFPAINGRNYEIQRSFNLEEDWGPLQTVMANGTTGTFIDPEFPLNTRAFYRVLALP
jgi:hypothetical protein